MKNIHHMLDPNLKYKQSCDGRQYASHKAASRARYIQSITTCHLQTNDIPYNVGKITGIVIDHQWQKPSVTFGEGSYTVHSVTAIVQDSSPRFATGFATALYQISLCPNPYYLFAVNSQEPRGSPSPSKTVFKMYI